MNSRITGLSESWHGDRSVLRLNIRLELVFLCLVCFLRVGLLRI